MISGTCVPISPSVFMKKKFGMIVTSEGIMSALRSTRKMPVPPGNRSRANA
jgi:hypothetical protein